MDKKNSIREIKVYRHLGFTLVELLVVLVISLTVITLSTVAYGKLSANSYLKSSARHIAASLRYTRSYAVARGIESAFKIDLANRTYSFTGNNKSFQFKKNIKLDVFSASALATNKNAAVIRFAPDGSSSGGRITLSSRDKQYVVYVDWLTGRISVDD